MVAPFRERQVHKSIGSLAGGLLRTLDLGGSDPHSAEVELINYIARKSAYSSLKKDDVDSIWNKFRIEGKNKLDLQSRVLKITINHMMSDFHLTGEKRKDLNHLVNTMGMEISTGMQVCQAIGREFYFNFLKEAKADGVITDEARQKLAAVKKIFSINTVVPEAGIDKATYFRKHFKVLEDAVGSLAENISDMKSSLDRIEETNPNITELNDFSEMRDTVTDYEVQNDDYSSELMEVTVEDEDAIDHLQALEHQFMDLVKEVQKFDFPKLTKGVSEWRDLGKREIKKLNTGVFDQRKAKNRELVTKLGFSPKGSPKQKAWVNDIIAEQCLTSPFWAFVQTKNQLSNPSESDLIYTRFANWLKTKPCGWWIGKFQETDLEEVFNRFSSDGVRAEGFK